ncbi:hypothetical protein [Curtobacterium sp. MCSS17_007]|uniref:hypothetical protein n=1 Tax=Curtobacterium sp. MCSS17_007 TaxID=2175646 RepID=UPI0015E8DDD0|nr:hypothetical protein [Curtobacterium sp. MCSS17_007]WIE74963.1 hypothetical protein DEJ22_011950 [Curtobacterium sp. MCSS17_007]
MDRGQQHEAETQTELGRFLDDFVRSMETWSSRDARSSQDARSSRAGTVPDTRDGDLRD